MSDFDRDPRVDRLLNEVGSGVAGYLDPPGADAVYATVRQRRRNRALAAGVLALAVVGGPTVGLALASGGGSGRPADRPPATGSSATSSPSGPASPSPSLSPSASPTPAAPDGRISLDELKRAKPRVPAWPATAMPECKQGNGVEFVGQPVYTDVDGDGAEETAAWLRCQGGGEFKVSKVVVFDRDATGKVITLGQVLQTPDGGDPGVGVWKVWEIQPTDDGHVRVDVGDYWPCCGTPRDLPQHQWRTYGWEGRRFVQTGGPAKFGPNPKITDLRVTADDLVMTEQADGAWRGTLKVKVRNAGSFPAMVSVGVDGTARLDGIGPGWSRCQPVPVATEEMGPRCDGGTLAAGRSWTLSLTYSAPTRPSGTLEVSAHHYYQATDYPDYPDLNYDDNHVNVAVRAG